jgi:hypothetical protein
VSTKLSAMLVNREQELPGVIAVFRGAYSRHADDPCWQGFVTRLSAASPEFARLWARQDVAEPGTREKLMKHERVGEMRFTTTILHSPAPETRMVIYSPMDDGTRAAIDRLLTET